MSTLLTRRMTSPDRPYSNSINSNVENNEMDEETLANQVTNPLRPSNAYMASLRKAQSSERGNDASVGYSKRPGKKTIATALFLFVGGLILFIIGAVYFWNSSDFHTLQGITQAQGFDMLIAGSIMLLPGSYACIGLFGAWRKWRGYSFDAMPLFDYTIEAE